MSDPRATNPKDNTVAKTAGVIIFSGICLSILKSLNPLSRNRNETRPLSESTTQPIQMPTQPPPPKPQELIIKKPISCVDQILPETSESSQRTVKIVKGDTLWGLSRKYGASIDAIKEANGLTGNTIYAGKELKIP